MTSPLPPGQPHINKPAPKPQNPLYAWERQVGVFISQHHSVNHVLKP